MWFLLLILPCCLASQGSQAFLPSTGRSLAGRPLDRLNVRVEDTVSQDFCIIGIPNIQV